MLVVEQNNKLDSNKISFEISALKKLNDLFLAQKDILLKHFNIGLMEISDRNDYLLNLNKFLEEFNDLFSKINTSVTDINELLLMLDNIKKLSNNGSNSYQISKEVNIYNALYMEKYPGLIDCIIYITDFVEELFITPSYEKSVEHRKSIFSAATAYNEKQSQIQEKIENKAEQRSKILDEFLSNEKEEKPEKDNKESEKENTQTSTVKVDLQAIKPEETPIIAEALSKPSKPDEKPIIRKPRPNPDYKTSLEKPLLEKQPDPMEERIKNAAQNEMNRIVEEDNFVDQEKKEEENEKPTSFSNIDNIPEVDMEHTNEEINKFVAEVAPEAPNELPAAALSDSDIPDSIKKLNKKDKNEDEANEENAKKDEIKLNGNSIPQRVTKLPLQDNNTLIISEKSGYVYLPFKVSDLKSEYLSKSHKYSGLVDLVNKDYTVPISRYKNSVTSRFKEAYLLMTNKEKASALSGLELGLELAFNYSLHPAIISACKNLDELDEYLDALESKDLSQFNAFKVKFELMPKK